MYLGLDLGTSGVKALLIDAEPDRRRLRPCVARRIAAASRLVGAEPCATGSAREAAVAELKARMRRNWPHVKGIGLSGHMHGATLLDASDNVLRPCILWNDTRSHAEAARARRRPALSQTHRQHRLSRLHRAEARLGEEQRAGVFDQGAQRCCCRRIFCGSG